MWQKDSDHVPNWKNNAVFWLLFIIIVFDTKLMVIVMCKIIKNKNEFYDLKKGIPSKTDRYTL